MEKMKMPRLIRMPSSITDYIDPEQPPILQQPETTNNENICSDCGNIIPESDMKYSVEGGERIVCTRCYSNYITCADCGDMCQIATMKEVNGNLICENCIEDNYYKCYECDEYEHENNIREGLDGEYYCDDCWRNKYFTCENCENIHNVDDMSSDDNVCNECYISNDDDDDDESSNTSLDTPVHPIVRKAWNNRKHITSFGIELETHNNFYPTEWFKRVYDGSINGNGREYVSAVLPYDKTGLKIVKDFCKYTKEKGATIGTDCGYHLHLGGYRNSYINIKKVWIGYMLMEKIFFNMMPKSRRDNRFCRRFSQDYTFERVLNKNNIARLVSYYYSTQLKAKKNTPRDHYNDKRYYFINFHSWLSGQTVEFRLHAGTLNYDKIQKWMKINKIFMDWLTSKTTTINDVIKLDDKQFYNMIGKKLAEYIQQRISEFGIDNYTAVTVKSITRRRRN